MGKIVDIVEINESYKPISNREKEIIEDCASLGGGTVGYKIDFEGFEYKTLYILIDNDQECCEEWGYTCSDDNPKEFIGAEVKEVVETRKDTVSDGTHEDTIFVTVKTDKGDFQIKAYTYHNGYYGHNMIIETI